MVAVSKSNGRKQEAAIVAAPLSQVQLNLGDRLSLVAQESLLSGRIVTVLLNGINLILEEQVRNCGASVRLLVNGKHIPISSCSRNTFPYGEYEGQHCASFLSESAPVRALDQVVIEEEQRGSKRGRELLQGVISASYKQTVPKHVVTSSKELQRIHERAERFQEKEVSRFLKKELKDLIQRTLKAELTVSMPGATFASEECKKNTIAALAILVESELIFDFASKNLLTLAAHRDFAEQLELLRKQFVADYNNYYRPSNYEEIAARIEGNAGALKWGPTSFFPTSVYDIESGMVAVFKDGMRAMRLFSDGKSDPWVRLMPSGEIVIDGAEPGLHIVERGLLYVECSQRKLLCDGVLEPVDNCIIHRRFLRPGDVVIEGETGRATEVLEIQRDGTLVVQRHGFLTLIPPQEDWPNAAASIFKKRVGSILKVTEADANFKSAREFTKNNAKEPFRLSVGRGVAVTPHLSLLSGTKALIEHLEVLAATEAQSFSDRLPKAHFSESPRAESTTDQKARDNYEKLLGGLRAVHSIGFALQRSIQRLVNNLAGIDTSLALDPESSAGSKDGMAGFKAGISELERCVRSIGDYARQKLGPESAVAVEQDQLAALQSIRRLQGELKKVIAITRESNNPANGRTVFEDTAKLSRSEIDQILGVAEQAYKRGLIGIHGETLDRLLTFPGVGVITHRSAANSEITGFVLYYPPEAEIPGQPQESQDKHGVPTAYLHVIATPEESPDSDRLLHATLLHLQRSKAQLLDMRILATNLQSLGFFVKHLGLIDLTNGVRVVERPSGRLYVVDTSLPLDPAVRADSSPVSSAQSAIFASRIASQK